MLGECSRECLKSPGSGPSHISLLTQIQSTGAVCAKNCSELPRVQTQVSSNRLEEVLEQFPPQDLTNGFSSTLSSNDILIGEDDRDSAFAGAGRDLMIGGGTRQQSDPSELLDKVDSGMAEWAQGNT